MRRSIQKIRVYWSKRWLFTWCYRKPYSYCTSTMQCFKCILSLYRCTFICVKQIDSSVQKAIRETSTNTLQSGQTQTCWSFYIYFRGFVYLKIFISFLLILLVFCLFFYLFINVYLFILFIYIFVCLGGRFMKNSWIMIRICIMINNSIHLLN